MFKYILGKEGRIYILGMIWDFFLLMGSVAIVFIIIVELVKMGVLK